MITLPAAPKPNGLRYELLDYGFVQRGASSVRVNRAGSRWRLEISFPPMMPDTARTFLARLTRAKREGLQIALPLLGVSQGSPGTPVVDGAGQAGAALALRGMTPGYQIKDGFWLTATETNGTAYLHQVAVAATVAGNGKATVQIEPPLRAPFPDGATVQIAAPIVQGFVDGDSLGWDVPLNRMIAPSFVIEEFA